jgi:hypothetical protein
MVCSRSAKSLLAGALIGDLVWRFPIDHTRIVDRPTGLSRGFKPTDAARREKRPVSGRVSDAGRARAVDGGIGAGVRKPPKNEPAG